MRDEECVAFLQWALPQLRMRWAGFRKVRGQVCKRIARRMQALGIEDEAMYRLQLQRSPAEWSLLDGLCRVSVSRFYRDKLVFAFLEKEVLPALARQAIARGDDRLRVWSVGCGSGEEPYTVAIVWQLGLQSCFADLVLEVLATDADPQQLMRGREACYPYSAIKNLPPVWRDRAFTRQDQQFCLAQPYRQQVRFVEQDVRSLQAGEAFDLVLCRNLVFTYFVEQQQCEILQRLRAAIRPGGALLIGIHEELPACRSGLSAWSERLRVYRQATAAVRE